MVYFFLTDGLLRIYLKFSKYLEFLKFFKDFIIF